MTPRARKTRRGKPQGWRKAVTELGVTVYLFERPGSPMIYREVRDASGKQTRKSLKHGDRALAEQQARTLARCMAEIQLHGAPVTSLTFGRLLALYFAHKAPQLSEARRARAETIFRPYFVAHFGESFPVDDLSQTQLDAYVLARRQRTIISPKHRGVSTAPRDGTIRSELNWLKAVFHWAQGFRSGGRPLIERDVFAGLVLPHERNVRRPRTDEARYNATMAVADQVDAAGRLACMLALARHTGRRINAICQLLASDVLYSRDQVDAALARIGQSPEDAKHMPHGAILWRSENDKQGFEAITAISSKARAALDAYRRRQPRAGLVPLFPDLKRQGKAITRAGADHLLRRAEQKAGLAKLERGMWHPLRRSFASERKHQPDVDVASAAGWRDLATMRRSYQQPDPETTLKVLENEPASPNASPAIQATGEGSTA